ncbi:MAG: DUF4168 domain-containing protein [Nostocaceae cyanobacterium]|nr:DUF4168 domain-containing protein [Nostocaceae cyanobacterium]
MLSHIFFFGIVATTVASSSLVFNSPAMGQTPTKLTETEMINYAKTWLTMNSAREEALVEIKKMMSNQTVPKITCNDPKSIRTLPRKAKKIVVDFCQNFQRTVEENGLDTQSFNEITRELQSNNDLKRQIHNILIRLQQNP